MIAGQRFSLIYIDRHQSCLFLTTESSRIVGRGSQPLVIRPLVAGGWAPNSWPHRERNTSIGGMGGVQRVPGTVPSIMSPARETALQINRASHYNTVLQLGWVWLPLHLTPAHRAQHKGQLSNEARKALQQQYLNCLITTHVAHDR